MTTERVIGPHLENLIWSDIEYNLCEFVDRFPLPQIVKVQEGYYGPTEDSCIGAEQILTLHCVKTTEKVLARDRKKRELHIPLNCSQKVELRPAEFRGIYETVEEISRIPARFVRVTQGYYLEEEAVSLNPGDKLEVIRVEQGLGGKEDGVVFLTEERNPIRLPFNVSAGFQSLLDGREYYLKELMMSSFKLPVYFQFTEPPSITRRSSEGVFNTSLGVLSFEKVYQDSTVICTTKEGSVRTVVSCPKNLPVTINVARGALSDDKDYVRICRFFHDGISLLKIENMEIQNIYASRNTIREYEYIVDDLSPPPPVPPRESAEDSSLSSSQVPEASDSDSGDDSHDYTYIDEPVTDKSTPFQKPKPNGVIHVVSGGKASAEMVNLDKNLDEAAINHDDEDDDYENVDENYPAPVVKGGEPTTKNEPVKPPRKSKEAAKQNPDENKPEVKKVPPAIKPKPPSIKAKPMWKQNEKEKSFVVPDDLSRMSIKEVSQFLRHFGFESFLKVFAENDVDGDLLVNLTDEELKALGLNAFQCKKISRLVGGWRPKK